MEVSMYLSMATIQIIFVLLLIYHMGLFLVHFFSCSI